MLSVILSWIYIILISYIWGTAFLDIIGKGSSYYVKSAPAVLMAGLSTLTVYAQIFSIFYKVSLLANIVMIIITLLCVAFKNKALNKGLAIMKAELKTKDIVFVLLLFVLFAYGTSSGFMHYDTDLYHAQSIRWIEEYGVVKGLGNLQTRLAYNSAAFCLSALFSFSFLNIQSFHTLAGLYAFIVMLICRKLFSKEQLLKISLSNVARVVAIYYILNIFDEMVSPASDYFVTLMILSVVIFFLDLVEEGIDDYFPYALLSLLGLMVFSSKISGAFIILIVIYPVIVLIRDKDIRSILKFLITGLIAVAPFIVRNYYLSGYLIYPIYGIDIFDVEHKIPKGLAWYDSTEIKMYGRGHLDVSRANESLSRWVPDWIKSLDMINKVSFVAALAGLLLLILLIARALIKREKGTLKKYLLIATVNICFVMWFITSPNIRFGCIFLWMAPALCFADAYMLFISSKDKLLIYKAFIIIFLAYKAVTFSREFVTEFSTEYMICQQDYSKYDAIEYELHGITFYYPKEGDRMGYDKFPSSPIKAEDIFIGERIEDGFKDVTH